MGTEGGQFLGQDKDKNISNVRSQVAFQVAVSRKICHPSITTTCSSISELLLNISLSVLWALSLLVSCPLLDTLFFFSQAPSPHPLPLYLCITGAQGKEPAQRGEVWAEGEEGEEMHIELLCLKDKGFSRSKNKFPILCLTSTYPHWGEDKINHLGPMVPSELLGPTQHEIPHH